MSSPARRGMGWLRRLGQRSGRGPEAESGSGAVLPVEELLGTLEASVCEALVRPQGVGPRAGTDESEPGEAPPRNAFGQPVQDEVGNGPAGCVALGTGMALAGLRAAVFLRGDELAAAHAELRLAAERLAPLLVHAANGGGGHAGYHEVAGSGCFQLLAESGQQALDLSLVARWLAERSLVPGLVATDGDGIESLHLPEPELVRTYLGRPDEPIASPSEAQRILFGGERPRLLPWFDPDRPVATGGIRGVLEEGRARLGRRLFFQDHVADLARQGMAELTRLTGRTLSFVNAYRLEDAELVLVTQGAAVQTARAVADHVRRAHSWKVGVVGVTWLRPFPTRELAEALRGRRAVAVVEVLDAPLAAAAPLLRELEAALGVSEGWISATCNAPGPDPARLAALCALLRQPDRPRSVALDLVAVPSATGFPRRDALVQSLAGAYPELREAGLPAVEPPGPDPERGRSVGLLGRQAELPADAFVQLARAAASECGPFVRGTALRPEPGSFEARVRAGPVDFADPGPRAPVSLLLVATDDLARTSERLDAPSRGATVLLASSEPPERFWAALPDAWRRAVLERELQLFTVYPAFRAGIAALRACLRGEEAALLEAGEMTEVAWRELPASDVGEREMPRVVRRIERVRPAHDSLPRFWGEVVQPRRGGAPDEGPDPLATAGAIPAGASALQPGSSAAQLPALTPELCSGCGRCWTACPEAAIGVTALATDVLLTSASRRAGTAGRSADALRRAHKNLARQLAGQLVESNSGALTADACREAWAWLAKRMEIPAEERPEYDAAFEATLAATVRLRPALTRPFFHEPEERSQGTGEVLVLAVDPQACLGCGLCVAVCPEGALQAVERTPTRTSELEEGWGAWEALPDTPGETLARAADHPEVGPLAAVLLSRHCAQAQVGGPGGEPGSGERLAARLVTGLVEHHAQRRLARLLTALEEEREALVQTLHARLGEGLSGADPDTLAEALDRVTRGRAGLSELAQQLDGLGAPATFDRRPLLAMARLAGELDRCRRRLAEGEDGLGRARFGVVVAGGTPADWIARYPLHPYYAPLTLAPPPEGLELTRGLARGLAAAHVELVRTLRRARVEARSPPDRPARLAEIEALRWEDLEPEDRAACPPLLLLADDRALLEHGPGALTLLLASDLPVKVVLLDGRGRLGPGPEPALLAMAHRQSFVLSTSLAHPEHLARGVTDALAWPGPALIHVHAPSPLRHGFAPDATLEQARRAVEGRAHLLFRYDPSAEGLFGLRASLAGNPALERDWAGTSFADWAAGESRFSHHFEPTAAEGGVPLIEWLSLPERERASAKPTVEVEGQTLSVGAEMARAAAERLAIWNTLRELTGLAGPFAERIRAQLEKELAAEHRAELDEQRAGHEAGLAELRAGADREAVTRLKQRLMALAGQPAKDRSPGGTRA